MVSFGIYVQFSYFSKQLHISFLDFQDQRQLITWSKWFHVHCGLHYCLRNFGSMSIFFVRGGYIIDESKDHHRFKTFTFIYISSSASFHDWFHMDYSCWSSKVYVIRSQWCNKFFCHLNFIIRHCKFQIDRLIRFPDFPP